MTGPCPTSAAERVDVAIIGAGIAGIGAALHLQRRLPDRTYVVLEARDAIGGTWDLFRYPGVRCDSDMQTLGFELAPWGHDDTIVEGEEVRDYLVRTAAEHGIDEHIRFGCRVVHASWSSKDAVWRLQIDRVDTGERVEVLANFVVAGAGYYDYDQAHTPDLPGLDRFEGEVVHPQFWPEDLGYADKRVVIVGSGATAVTLLPSMADEAAHVTMLQRSPGYLLSLPQHDATSRLLRHVLPDDLVDGMLRARNTVAQFGIFQLSQRFPGPVRRLLLAGVRRQVGRDVDMRHFTPDYDPWDERLCVVPDGDLFEVVRSGRGSIVTDQIQTFTPTGIRLQSGQELSADVVVTATGMQLLLLGGIELEVDGRPVDPTDRLTYRGAMLSGVPNLAMMFGYVNTSWTRKVDLVAAWVCRVLAEMDRLGMRQATPRGDPSHESDEPFIDMQSGYVQRSRHLFPRQGTKAPWRNRQNVLLDTVALRLLPVNDGHLRFTNPAHPRVEVTVAHSDRTPVGREVG